MPELASFRMNRAVDAQDASRARTLELAPDRPADGGFLARLTSLVTESGEVPRAEIAVQARALAEEELTGLPVEVREALLDPQHVAWPDDPPEGLVPLLALDRWLLGRDDRPTYADLVAAAGDLPVLLTTVPDDARPPIRIWDGLIDMLAAASLVPREGPLTARVTRLLLVAGLVRGMAVRRGTPTPDDVHARLRATPTLPSPPFPQVLPPDRVELARAATVADLYVVRSEWRCYRAGEIADITNVLTGEKLEHSVLAIDEQEITESDLDETTTTEERSRETTDRSELSEETQNQVDLAIHAEAEVETSTKGPTKIDATVAGSLDFSRSESMRRATTVAREAVARAAVTVSRRVRRERTQRRLSRTEIRDARTLDNTGDGAEHVRGIERWVERVDRYQVVRYPDRLQLEFQLPEPGNALYRLLTEPAPTLVPDPGEFTVTLAGITRDTWRGLVGDAQAIGVTAPPEAKAWVSASLSANADSVPSNDTTVWNAPSAHADADIAVPSGYRAVHVRGGLRAVPTLAKWRRETSEHSDLDDLAGYHGMNLALQAGGVATTFYWSPTTKEMDDHGGNAVMRVDRPAIQLREATGRLTLDEKLSGVDGQLTVSARADGGSSVAAWVTVECDLTDEAWARWQLSVYNALLAEHQSRERDFRDEQERTATARGGLRERSPAAHADLIRDELKRQVTAWLTGQSPFPGRPAVRKAEDGADGHADEHVDVAAALAASPEIQFLEQAFEWQNLVYVCHPYYWATPSTWDRRRRIEAGDPVLARFLAAGSVRVVVPARPTFQTAVMHWLLWRQPWFGETAPLPGQDLFVSVAQEIRDQLVPPEDGEPGESWEAVLPTSFRWLDTSETLPHNPHATLGLPPHEPARLLCDDAVPSPTPPDDDNDGDDEPEPEPDERRTEKRTEERTEGTKPRRTLRDLFAPAR